MIPFRFTPLLLVCLAVAAPAQSPASAPRLVAPREGSELGAGRLLQWEGLPEASAYDVIVCKDRGCTAVATKAVGIRRTQWQVPPLAAGTYYWRVTAIAANEARLGDTAGSAFTIAPYVSGRIVEDVEADGNRLEGRGGVRVLLFRDGAPAPAATAETDAAGEYVLHPIAGTYWLTVDGRGITPAGGASAGAAVQAEQTFGPAGAVCAAVDGKTVTRAAPGACFGGAFIAGLDDPSNPAKARSVARIVYDGGSLANVDFGFSFNVVTNLADAEPPPRGSLRQFVLNANAIHGSNPMRFVPMLAPTTTIRERGTDISWWTVTLATALPALADNGTTIDGLAHDPTATLIAAGRERRDRADLDPHRADLELALAAPLRIASRSALHAVAVNGASPDVVVSADSKLDYVIAGSHPNHDASGLTAAVVVSLERGTATMRHCFISSGTTAGIDVRPGTKLEAADVEVANCGAAPDATGAAIRLASDDSQLMRGFLHNNVGAGIQIDGSRNRVQQTNITDNAFGILLGPKAADNMITACELVWNHGGAVVADPTAAGQPMRNRVSQNYFNENGGIPIQLIDPQKEVTAPQAVCGGNMVPVPKIEKVSLRHSGEPGERSVEVHGSACPGTSVELYTSFVTGELQERVRQGRGRDLPSIREALNKESVESRDTKTSDRLLLPSVGEFHFAAAATAGADGTFSVTVPLGVEFRLFERISSDDDAARRLYGHVSVAAVAIERNGSTSEFSPRKLVD